MAYNINKYNGDQLAVVEDGTINTTIDLKLIGKNYAGYGEAQNENYVWLLENFAGHNAPAKAIDGQLWYDTNSGVQKLKIKYPAGWHTLGINDVIANVTNASGLNQGDLFWTTDTQQLWCKGATENVLIGGKLTGVITQMKSTTVISDAVPAVTYNIIEAVINDVTVFVISSAAATFTLATSEVLRNQGYTTINPGLTLKSYSSSTQDSSTYKVFGSSTDSDRLGGVLASDYVTKSDAEFSNLAHFADAGISIGAPSHEVLKILNESITINNVTTLTPTIYNYANSTIQFKTTVSSVVKTALKLVGQDLIPGNPGLSGSNIGSTTDKFNNVYANAFVGNASSATGVVYSSVTRTPDTDATAGSVVIRTLSSESPSGGGTLPAGSIKANKLYVTGSQTIYGDLAENYLADETYEVGTVVMIGGEAEVTLAVSNNRALGVVSENPGHLMNVNLENGTAIALKGRVPVKVIGSVSKGDRLVASSTPGFASVLTDNSESGFVFAIALSSDIDNVVEAVII